MSSSSLGCKNTMGREGNTVWGRQTRWIAGLCLSGLSGAAGASPAFPGQQLHRVPQQTHPLTFVQPVSTAK